ncbi:MAG: metallophosphoesterase [Rhodocyclaceae bacterium]|nr:metallophosphoesterase [Rhodocyclaceae bacterium]
MTAAHPTLRLIHLSDLHFGAQHAGASDTLLRTIHELSPTLTLITGDLTQRARNSQFIAARQFFDQLPGAWVALPGNHDMPLFRPWHRLFAPRTRYRHHIGNATTERLDWPELRMALLDSTDPLAWRAGRLKTEAVNAAAAWLAQAQPGQLRIAAAHHPFARRERGNKGGMAGARHARHALIDTGGADILLWGHLHRSEITRIDTPSGRHAIGIGVGSPTSSRHVSDGLYFHQIDMAGDHINLLVWRRLASDSAFLRVASHRFVRDAAGWRAVSE